MAKMKIRVNPDNAEQYAIWANTLGLWYDPNRGSYLGGVDDWPEFEVDTPTPFRAGDVYRGLISGLLYVRSEKDAWFVMGSHPYIQHLDVTITDNPGMWQYIGNTKDLEDK